MDLRTLKLKQRAYFFHYLKTSLIFIDLLKLYKLLIQVDVLPLIFLHYHSQFQQIFCKRQFFGFKINFIYIKFMSFLIFLYPEEIAILHKSICFEIDDWLPVDSYEKLSKTICIKLLGNNNLCKPMNLNSLRNYHRHPI